MRFWTAFQDPLFQAALIENGKIVHTIPDHPPKTPVRFVHIVGEFKDKLILTRRSDHQIWSLDGKTHERQIYTPLVYAPHWVGEFDNHILAGSGGLDVIYLMDLNGEPVWEWWLCDRSKRPEDFRPLMGCEDWVDYQVSRRLPEERMCGFNSIYKQPDGSLMVTFMKMNVSIHIDPYITPKMEGAQGRNAGYRGFMTGVITRYEFPHDIQLDQRNGRLVYGAKAGLIIDEEVVLEREFVKRVRQIPDGYILTHEKGVVVTDMDGKEKESFPLPRPFGIFHLEM